MSDSAEMRHLLQNPQIADMVRAGKVTQQQLMEYLEKQKLAAPPAVAAPSSSAVQTPTPPATAAPKAVALYSGAFKSSSPPMLSSNPNPGDTYPIPQLVPGANPGPVPWAVAQQGRPTLTGGMTSGRVAGTPSQVLRAGDDVGSPLPDDSRARRKSAPGAQSMRRTIQDLVASIDPGVQLEPDVEDLLLDIADEFVDSIAHFGCRLAQHRGGDALQVRDLQLHLERSHNIRIPGFASDETRPPSLAPPAGQGGAATKKPGAGPQMTLRSQRLALVQQSKRESGRLI